MWDGDKLLNAYDPEIRISECSKPTVWDGDLDDRGNGLGLTKTCSKPTVWDGDGESVGRGEAASEGSKPTVWDGDTAE